MKWYIILTLIWIVCITAIYTVRYINSRKSHNRLIAAILPRKRNKLKTHLQIIFLAPIIVVSGIIILVCQHIKKKKNKCEEVKSEHNITLMQIQEGLPDTPHKQASIALGNALIDNEYSLLETLLDDKCVFVLYNSRSITGKEEIVGYWKNRMIRNEKENVFEKYKVSFCAYYSNVALMINTRGYKDAYVLFKFEKEKVSHMVMAPVWLPDQFVGGGESLDKFPMKVDIMNRHIEEEISPISDRIPCLQCGLLSESLKWYNVLFKAGMHGYSGEASICPNCNCLVEYRPTMRLRYEEPVGNDTFNDIDHDQSESATGESYLLEENDSEFVRVWNGFHKYLDTVAKANTSCPANDALDFLPSLSLFPGVKLGLHGATFKDIGDNSFFYTYNEKTKETINRIEGVRIEQSANGIWQFYLLRNAHTYLPAFWHGNYSNRIFIMSMKDCQEIEQMKDRDLRGLAKTGLIYPSVVIEEQTENRVVASVYCCYWNNWKGLVREQVRFTVEDNVFKTSENISELILYQYDCGIVF